MNTRYGEALDWVDVTSISAAGVALDGVRRGLATPVGLVEATAATLYDAVDGRLARHFGKETEFGAGLDASLDKIRNLAIAIAEWRQDLAPRSALGITAVSNVINAGATAVAIKHSGGHDLSPVKEGKVGAAAQNFALGAYPFSAMIKDTYPKMSKVAKVAGHVATGMGAILQTKAAAQYLERNTDLSEKARNSRLGKSIGEQRDHARAVLSDAHFTRDLEK